MKVRIMSDLHLEFGGMEIPKTDDEKDTTLILAGDIGVASKKWSYQETIEDWSMRFKDIIYIMGNHEHYHGKFLRTREKLLEALSDCPNVHVLEKDTVVIDGVAFICATLWTSMNNCDILIMEQARLAMNDYSIIRHGPPSEPWKQKLLPKDTVMDHVNAVHYIFEEIEKQKEAGNKICVVTHQAPSELSVHEKYKGDPINFAYFSNLEERILDAGELIWVHGHTHHSFDYEIGDGRVICNPRGYAPNDINPDFDPLFTVEM